MKKEFIMPIIVIMIMLLASCEDNNYTSDTDLFKHYTLGGQTWVLTQYSTDQANSLTTANDTLVFADSTHYTWNGIPSTYSYYHFDGYYFPQLSFDNSPFGPLIAKVPDSFEVYYHLNGVKFNDGTNTFKYTMWFKRIL